MRRVLFYVGLLKKALNEGPEMGACLACLKTIEEASVAEMMSLGNMEGREEVSNIAGTHHVRSLDHGEDFEFYSRCVRKLLEV